MQKLSICHDVIMSWQIDNCIILHITATYMSVFRVQWSLILQQVKEPIAGCRYPEPLCGEKSLQLFRWHTEVHTKRTTIYAVICAFILDGDWIFDLHDLGINHVHLGY